MDSNVALQFCNSFYSDLDSTVPGALLQPGRDVRTDIINMIIIHMLAENKVPKGLINKFNASENAVDRTRVVAQVFAKACEAKGISEEDKQRLQFIGNKFETMQEFGYLDGQTRKSIFVGRIRLNSEKKFSSTLATFALIQRSNFSENMRSFWLKISGSGFNVRKKVLEAVNTIRNCKKDSLGSGSTQTVVKGAAGIITAINQLEELKHSSCFIEKCVNDCLKEVKDYQELLEKAGGVLSIRSKVVDAQKELNAVEYGENHPFIKMRAVINRAITVRKPDYSIWKWFNRIRRGKFFRRGEQGHKGEIGGGDLDDLREKLRTILDSAADFDEEAIKREKNELLDKLQLMINKIVRATGQEPLNAEESTVKASLEKMKADFEQLKD